MESFILKIFHRSYFSENVMKFFLENGVTRSSLIELTSANDNLK